MRRSIRRYLSMLLVMLMTVSAAAVICTKNAYAGSFSGGYISLGADLTEEEKSKADLLAVFKELGYEIEL